MNTNDLFDAFASVSPEYLDEMVTPISTEKHSGRVIVATIIAVIAIAGASSYAAIKYNLGRGMNDLQADESQQQELVDSNAAIIYETNEDYSELQVTQNGVTMMPVSVIADERYAYISFKVSGFSFDEEIQDPVFEQINVSEDESLTNSMNYTGWFYDGLITTNEGVFYDDNTPADRNADGGYIKHYRDSYGDLYFVLCIYGDNMGTNILGQTIYFNFSNLMETYKQKSLYTINGEWSFCLNMPTQSSSVHMDIKKQIEGTQFFLESIDISPVSLRLNYQVSGQEQSIPDFAGIVLDNGTMLLIGRDGICDFDQSNVYANAYFTRVIDPAQIQALCFHPDGDSTEIMTVPIK